MNSLTELIASFHRIFAEDQVNVNEVIMLMESYKSNPAEWRQYAVFDEHKYTRNLVDIGNGKYNLMVLCWGPGMGSSIHDHSNAHCFVKILEGVLVETKYAWPEDSNFEAPLKRLDQNYFEENSVSYMSDKLGLHRMENPSHSDGAVSLHLYIPPYESCNAFDERTGTKTMCQVTFFTKYGKKVDYTGKKSGSLIDYGATVLNAHRKND
ncbi:cysteine dioxygenase type I [Dictyocaulus viviparus]|uniref:Cysteine dioxygenase n=1 Tax=Dictyocaulus viviparus TaxID=29172 RepID=A0A0D8XJH8_DICVI|nr:cysteine dioxygenase type I [Dictyocaulus viviparus]